MQVRERTINISPPFMYTLRSHRKFPSVGQTWHYCTHVSTSTPQFTGLGEWTGDVLSSHNNSMLVSSCKHSLQLKVLLLVGAHPYMHLLTHMHHTDTNHNVKLVLCNMVTVWKIVNLQACWFENMLMYYPTSKQFTATLCFLPEAWLCTILAN